MDYLKILRDGFSLWPRDRQALGILGTIFAVNFGVFLAQSILGMLLLGQNYTSILDNSGNLGPSASIAVAGAFLVYSAISFPLQVILFFASSYLSAKLIIRLLQLAGLSTAEFSLNKFFRYLISCIWAAIMVVTSWYVRPLFMIFAALVISFPALILLTATNNGLGIIGLILWGLLAVLYTFVIIYNALRISVVHQELFLERNVGIRQSALLAWQMTKGKALNSLLLEVLYVPIVGVLIFSIVAIALITAFLSLDSLASHLLVGVIISFLMIPYIAIIESMAVSFYAQLRAEVGAKAIPATQSLPSTAKAPKAASVRKPARKAPSRKK